MKKFVRYLLYTALAAVLLYLAFRKVDLESFRSGLMGASWGWVAASMAFGLTAFFFRGLRWNGIMKPLGTSAGTPVCWGAVNVANMTNLAVPYSGELVRCGIVSRRTGLRYDRTLGTVVLERGWDLLSVIIVFIAVTICCWQKLGTFISTSIWQPLSDRFSWKVWLAAAVLAVLAAATFLLSGRVRRYLRGMLGGFTACFRMDRKWLFFLYTIFVWGMYWLQMVGITMALGLDLSLSDDLFLMAVGSLASFIPVPGGFGAYHYLISLALSSIYGLSWDTGMLYATLAHESQALLMILSGSISWAALSIRR